MILTILFSVVFVATACAATLIANMEHRPAPRIDRRKINRIELELGLPLSDYGEETVALLVADAEAKAKDTDQVIQALDDHLDPEAALKRKAAAAHAVPPHQMGKTTLLEGCPACGSRHDWDQRHGMCTSPFCMYRREPRREPHGLVDPMGGRSGAANWSRMRVVYGRPDQSEATRERIQPMDELYPVEIVRGTHRCVGGGPRPGFMGDTFGGLPVTYARAEDYPGAGDMWLAYVPRD